MFGRSKIDRLLAKRKTAALTLLLKDKRESVRLAAIRALGCCGDDLAYEIVVPLVRHSEASVRKNAVLALADMQRSEGRTCIEQQMLVEQDSQVRAIIETALMRFK